MDRQEVEAVLGLIGEVKIVVDRLYDDSFSASVEAAEDLQDAVDNYFLNIQINPYGGSEPCLTLIERLTLSS